MPPDLPAPLDFIFRRRSIRHYLDRPVDRDDLVRLLQAAMATPSTCNQQPWEFVVVTEREMLDELRRHLVAGRYNAPAAIAVRANLRLAHPGPTGRMYWPLDCSAATENILLAAPALGLGTVWIGVCPHPTHPRTVGRILSLPEEVIPFCLVYVGYPAEEKPARTQYDEKRVYWEQYVPRKPRARPKNLKHQ
jgi:nitroreductase